MPVLAIDEADAVAWTRHGSAPIEVMALFYESRRHVMTTTLELLRRIDHIARSPHPPRAHEIGGNCIEIEQGGDRIVLDFGRRLSARWDDDIGDQSQHLLRGALGTQGHPHLEVQAGAGHGPTNPDCTIDQFVYTVADETSTAALRPEAAANGWG